MSARVQHSTPAMPFANPADLTLPSGRPISQWVKLSARRILSHAAKEGYDGVITPDKFVVEELTGGALQGWMARVDDPNFSITEIQQRQLKAASKENMHLLPLPHKGGKDYGFNYLGLEKVDDDYLKGIDSPPAPGTSKVINDHPDESASSFTVVADEKGTLYKVTPETTNLGDMSNVMRGKLGDIDFMHALVGVGGNFNKGLKVSIDEKLLVNPASITGLKSNMMTPTRGTLNPGLAAHIEKIDEVVPEILTETAGRADGLPLFEKQEILYSRDLDDGGALTRDAYKFTENTSRRRTLDSRMGRKGSMLFQMGEGDMARASVEFTEDGHSLIRALNQPDIGSFVHEVGHVLRRNGLSDEAQDALEARYGIFDEWDEASEEDFAQAFMAYMQGKSPVPELDDAFEAIGGAMRKIYESSYDKPINGSLRRALDEMFGATKESKAASRRIRSLKAAKRSGEKKQNAVRARVAKKNDLISDTDEKMSMALDARKEAAVPIQEELDGLKSTMLHKGSEVSEKYNRIFRDLSGAGRRGKYAGQLVSSLRYANENVPEFHRRIFFEDYDKSVGFIRDRYNMNAEDASLILHAKIIEVDAKAGDVYGYHPGEKIFDAKEEGNLNQVMDRYGGREKVWNDPQVERLAKKAQEMQREFLIKESSDGALQIADPRFAYIGLRLTEDAQKAAWAQSAKTRELRDAAASGKKISGEGPASQHRATNRYFYKTDNPNPYWTDPETGEGWDFIWAGQVGSRPLPEEFEAYRTAYLRENPEEMLAKDIYDYNVGIRDAGGSPDQYMPTPGWSGDAIGNANGPAWMPKPYATSPFELNRPEMSHRFADMVGNEYKGQVWETDLGILLGKRVREHHRTASVADFVRNIMPEMKALSIDEVNDAVTNPRQGTTVTKGGNDLIINGIPYRRLSNEVANNRMFDRLVGSTSKTHYYPEDVASALEDYVTKISDDQNLTTIGRAFDYVQSMWKGSVLMNPAWTTVNVLGGIIHSVVVGDEPLRLCETLARCTTDGSRIPLREPKGWVYPNRPGSNVR